LQQKCALCVVVVFLYAIMEASMSEQLRTRKSIGTRSILADRSNLRAESAAPSSSKVPRVRDADHVTQIRQDVRRIGQGLKDGTLFEAQSILRANLDKRSTKSRRFSSPSRTEHGGGGEGVSHEGLEPDWDTIKRWPGALVEEEKALGDYFRRLKMIQLEQETRNIFIHDTNDDTQTVYTLSEVRQLEAEVKDLKEQLKVRKAKARQLRAEINDAAEGLKLFDQLQADVEECTAMIVEIEDLELELARLDAVHGIRARLTDDEKEDVGDVKTQAPPMGTFTRDEADEILNDQLMSMEQLESEQTVMRRQIEAAKKQLALDVQTLDRLNAEQKAAEKLAREAVIDTDRQRDHKLEAVCRGYTATVECLKNVMGIRSIDAPNAQSVRAVYVVSDARARQFCQEVAIDLRFASVNGDRLSSYEICTTSGRLLTEQYAPQGTQARRRLDMAVRANDASLLLQEALLCVESMEAE
jgi:hypothetical protein